MAGWRPVAAAVRQGLTSDRTAFSKRLWRLWEGPVPGVVLLLMPDEVRLRHARRLLTGARAPALLALERDVAQANDGDPVWRLPSVNAAIDLRSALDRAGVGSPLPAEPRLSRASIPWDIPGDFPGPDLPEYMLPALLKSAEKRALDLLSDWPLISRKDLASLLAVSESRASQLVIALVGFGLVTRVAAAGRRLALTDKGLALLARRDRASFSIAKRRWSVAPLDPEAPLDWRNVSGARSRQLLRNPHHTDAVHGFVAALARQSRSLGWEIVQLDPPRKASRYFRYDDALRSIHPDAFGVLRKGRTTWPFFLEWERRAVRPTTMAARIAPYLRYYSSHRPTDDHGARPAVLVVKDDEDGGDPLPTRGARGDAPDGGQRPPAGLTQRGVDQGWASGTRLAHPGGLRTRERSPGRRTPIERSQTMPLNNNNNNNNERQGPRRRRRAVVRLDTQALWERLALLSRSQNWLAREIGISPGYLSMLVNEGRAPSGPVRRRMLKALAMEDFDDMFTLEEPDDNP